MQSIIDRAQADGTLRPDVAFADIGLLIVRLSRPLPGPFPRALDTSLAHRHLDLLLDGLRTSHDRSMSPLPGPAMTLADLQAMPATSGAGDRGDTPGRPIDDERPDRKA